ncbi:MAG: hypothetical protein KBC57_09710 [Neisseriaceae bacterium]|nr:hypothetical protein [Neisseriaceae bacterium]MBP6862618.1 hypothetical protein [Neisseriaceae bacterium]
MTFSLKKASALALSLSLIGCANVSSLPQDATAADHLSRAYERSFTTDHRYNFEIEGKLVSFGPPNSKASASAAASDAVAAASEAVHDSVEADVNTAAAYAKMAASGVDAARADEADIEIRLEDAYDVENIDALISAEQNHNDDDSESAYSKRQQARQNSLFNTMKNFSVVAKGAIDLPNGRIEMTPSIQYYGNNIEAKASVPMALNLSKGEVLADPSAITSTFGWAMGLDEYGINEANGRFLRYQFDKDLLKDFPVKAFGKAYLDAMKKALAEVKPEQLKFVPVDAMGKQLGARQQISMTQSLPEMMAFSANTVGYFKTNIDAFLETYEGKPLPPEVLTFIEQLEIMPEMMTMGLDFNQSERGTVATQYYLGSNDRFLGMYLEMLIEEADMQFTIGTSMKNSNFGRPVWTVTPKEDNIYDIDPGLFK